MTAIKRISSPDCLKLLLALYLFFSFLFNISLTSEQHFSWLANSFLSGKLYFIDQLPNLADTVPYGGQYFWPLGPFPAILLMPGQFILNIFGLFFYQGYLNFFLGILVFVLVNKISRKFNYSPDDAFCLASAFCLSSVFVAVWTLSWSWYFAELVTVVLLLLLIYEFLNKKRYWLLGILIGLALLTRFTAAIAGTIVLLDLALSKETLNAKTKSFLLFASPIAISIGLLLTYNYLRFGDLFEQGYNGQIISGMSLSNRSFGLLSWRHLPGNLYYSLANLPSPIFYEGSKVMKFPFFKADPWGMSIFLTSPYLFYLFSLKYKDKFSKLLWVSIIAIALPVYLYYGIGCIQFGYRYSLDFMPFLFLLLIKNYREKCGELSPLFKKVIIASACLNIYLLSVFLLVPAQV
jgi:hypothetical protein